MELGFLCNRKDAMGYTKLYADIKIDGYQKETKKKNGGEKLLPVSTMTG